MRVLLLEDDYRVQELLGRALTAHGHAVVAHVDGAAAWEACQKTPFDLALLDVVVPGVDGLEVCRRLRGLPGGDATAVLIVTGAVPAADLPRVLSAGADDYLAKPFSMAELGVRLTILERLAAERARRADAERMQARLLDATRRVSASLDLGETLTAIADEALRLTDADAAVVAQPAPGGEYWALLAARGPLARHWDGAPVWALGQGALATALRTAQTVDVVDFEAADAPPRGPSAQAAGVRSVLAVPLRAGSAVLGVFGAQSRRPGHFTPAHQRLLEDLGQAAALAVAHAQEIAQRHEAEAALRASEARFRALVGNVPGMVYRCDLDAQWTLHYISDFVEEITGYPAADLVGRTPVRTWASVIHPDDAAGLDDAVRAAIARDEPFAVDYRVVRPDGGVRWLHDRGVAVRSEGGEILWIDGVAVDTTEQRRAEGERDELRARVARIEERERIAMDLHDVGVQTLFGLPMRLAGARRRVVADPEGSAALDLAKTAVGEAMARLREHVHAIRRSAEPDAGPLGAALKALADEVGSGTGFEVSVRVESAGEDALPPAAAEHVLHTAREALTNAARHSGAAGAALRLTRRGDVLVLTVRDGGRGFDPAAARGGIGLTNMRRRAELLGGELTIVSAKELGTIVRLEIPAGASSAAGAP